MHFSTQKYIRYEVDGESWKEENGKGMGINMKKWEMKVPQDVTMRPGMKVLYGERSDSRVNYIKDVVYARRGERELHLQLLIPGLHAPELGYVGKHPLVIHVQGSGWGKQNCYMALPNFYPLAYAGYVVASVEHRASDEAIFPAFLQDVKSAIRFLRANAKEYGIDPENIAIWGDSSGGHTAVMVGVTGDMEEFKTADYEEQSDAVSAVVDFYGPTDVTRINDVPRDPDIDLSRPQPEDILFGGKVAECPEIAAPGNPLNYITKEKEIPPILIAHGDQDAVVPFHQSVLLYDKLTECCKVVDFYKVLAADHGFFLWTPEMIDLVIRFIGMYLK